ncbi:glycoside hydrolase family 43 protein [Microbacterium sp. NPDC077663]|uniref:glycoside hydrolase family 43 protein n=1 Tax=Microbacterium sp. NPDC077663 TaxID=3364189 RepID=UPI0037C67502
MSSAYLMAYFTSETHADGEQIRFAVSDPGNPLRWTPLADGAPILRSTVGEHGVRDPFLLWDDARSRYVILATDLRVHTDGNWHRAVRTGSRALVVWESPDLVNWSEPRLVTVAPDSAGNTWAPKAFRDPERGVWTVIWASALFDDHDDRTRGTHQRLLAADTTDFAEFTPARIYFDPGHDVIDATFIHEDQAWFRFSANAHAPGNPAHIGHHIYAERGTALEDPNYTAVAIDVGRPELERGEGPAVFQSADGTMSYLLIDEFNLRGYQLFELETARLDTGAWRHLPSAELPPGARHGSVIPIPLDRRDEMIRRFR